MRTNIPTLFMATLLSAGIASTAQAQDFDDDLGTEDDSMGDTSSDSSMGDSSTSAPAAEATGSSGAWGSYSMGISTTFPTGGNPAQANLLYGLDADTFLDLGLGINFSKGSIDADGDPTTPATDESSFGLSLKAGYRMYKPMEGRIRPYIEPLVTVSIADFGAASDTLALGVGGLLGVDYVLMEQFTLGTGIGAGLNFSDGFDTINFGLLTASINATFWW